MLCNRIGFSSNIIVLDELFDLYFFEAIAMPFAEYGLEMVEEYGITEEDIYRQAVKNLKQDGYTFCTATEWLLEKILGKQVEIDYVLNPKILGGLRVQCGSKMFDDSLASKLNYLENIMKGK